MMRKPQQIIQEDPLLLLKQYIDTDNLEQISQWFVKYPLYTVTSIINSFGHTPLHYAAKTGKLSIVKWLISQKADIHCVDHDGFTPFLLAIKYGQFDTAKYLADCGASPLICNKNQQNTIHLVLAFHHDWQTYLTLFTEEQQKLLFQQLDKENKTVVHYAVATANKEIITQLVMVCPGFINYPTVYGETPLFYAVLCKRPTEIIQFLITQGADPNHLTINGYNALHLAQDQKNADLVALLLSAILTPYELPMKMQQALVALGKLYHQPELWEQQARQLLISNPALCKPIHTLSQKQAIFLTWLLLEWSDCFIYKAHLAFHEWQNASKEKRESKESSYKAAEKFALTRTAGLLAFCRKLQQHKIQLPHNLQVRVESQQLRLLLSLKQQAVPKIPNCSFIEILSQLRSLRRQLKKHRAKYYELAKQPLPKLHDNQPLLAAQWAKENQQFFIQLTEKLFLLALKITGVTLPDYVLIALGSMATGTMSLFSDLEYGFIVKTLSPEIREKAELACRWLNYLVTLMGETPDSEDPNKEISLLICQSGYCIDSGGNQPLSKREFINTPDKLALWIKETDLVTQTVLFSVAKISGKDYLIREYQQALQQVINQPLNNTFFNKRYWCQDQAIILLQDNISAYDVRKKNQRAIQESSEPTFNVKIELLRSSQILGDLCLFLGIISENMTVWQRLDALYQKSIFSKTNYEYLFYLLNVAIQLRFHVQGFSGYEYEEIHPEHTCQQQNSKFCINAPLKEVLIECYRILLPFYHLAEQFYQIIKNDPSAKPKVFYQQICYQEKAAWIEAQAYERMLSPQEAAEHYAQAIKIDPKNLKLRIQHLHFLELQRSLCLRELLFTQNLQEGELQKQLKNRNQFIQYLTEILVTTTTSPAPYLDVYQQLPLECRSSFRAELIIYSQSPERVYLLPILKSLHRLAEHTMSPQRQQRHLRWEKRFQTIAERVSSEELQNRIRICGPMLPAQENWVLKKEIACQLFNEKGEFQHDERYQGSHKVNRVLDLFFKPWSEMPGVTFKVELLEELIFNTEDHCESELIQFQLPDGQKIPVLVSTAIEGQTLHEVLTTQTKPEQFPSAIEELDLANFCRLALLAIFTRDEDGLPSNYILREQKIYPIDRDHAFFPPWMKEKNQDVLQLKIILWLFPQMRSPIPQAVKEEILKINIRTVLTQYVNESQVQNRYYQQIFGKETIEKWHNNHSSWFKRKNNNSTCAIPFQTDEINQLYECWETLRQLILEHENLTCEQVLSIIFPTVALAYHNTHGTAIERFAILGNYRCNLQGVLISRTLAIKTISIHSSMLGTTYLKLEELEPEQAQLALERLHLEEQLLKTTSQQISSDVTKYLFLTSTKHKETVLFGNPLSGTLKKNLAWNDLNDKKTDQLLQLILKEKTAFLHIVLPPQHSLTRQHIQDLVLNSPTLQVLHLSNGHKFTLDTQFLEFLMKNCPHLVELELTNLPTCKGEIILHFAKLKRLKIADSQITKLTLITPLLTYLRCPQNPSLTQINYLPNRLIYIDIGDCKKLHGLVPKQNTTFSDFIQLKTFKSANVTKFPYYKQISQYPFLLTLKDTFYEFAIPELTNQIPINCTPDVFFCSLQQALKIHDWQMWKFQWIKALPNLGLTYSPPSENHQPLTMDKLENLLGKNQIKEFISDLQYEIYYFYPSPTLCQLLSDEKLLKMLLLAFKDKKLFPALIELLRMVLTLNNHMNKETIQAFLEIIREKDYGHEIDYALTNMLCEHQILVIHYPQTILHLLKTIDEKYSDYKFLTVDAIIKLFNSGHQTLADLLLDILNKNEILIENLLMSLKKEDTDPIYKKQIIKIISDFQCKKNAKHKKINSVLKNISEGKNLTENSLFFEKKLENETTCWFNVFFAPDLTICHEAIMQLSLLGQISQNIIEQAKEKFANHLEYQLQYILFQFGKQSNHKQWQIIYQYLSEPPIVEKKISAMLEIRLDYILQGILNTFRTLDTTFCQHVGTAKLLQELIKSNVPPNTLASPKIANECLLFAIRKYAPDFYRTQRQQLVTRIMFFAYPELVISQNEKKETTLELINN